MTEIDLNDFEKEVTCIYRNEKYSVRDNGAVLRHSRENKKKRPKYDDIWTFGNPNNQNGYMFIANHRIHQIVATGFHGEPPTSEHTIVDHKDENRQNNRPENLHWVTRLENALGNPHTRRKIVYICGSVENFLNDPSLLRKASLPPNLEWMRTVTKEEANNYKKRLSIWAKSKNKTMKINRTTKRTKNFHERRHKPLNKWEVGLGGEPGLDFTQTFWCAQYMWREQIYLPCCPDKFINPIDDYFHNIKRGDVFCYSDDSDRYTELITYEKRLILISEFVHVLHGQTLIPEKREHLAFVVLCKNKKNKWAIIGVRFDEKSQHFIHFVLDLYLDKDEAYKAFHSKNEQTNFWSEGYKNNYKEI